MKTEEQFLLEQINGLYVRLGQIKGPQSGREDELASCLRGALTGLELLEGLTQVEGSVYKRCLPGLPDLIKRCKGLLG